MVLHRRCKHILTLFTLKALERGVLERVFGSKKTINCLVQSPP
jgi:hypothetical protein